jgi:hypothetical protein
VQPESGVKGAAWDTVKREGLRMLSVMVSAMVVMAAFLYYHQRQEHLAQGEATAPPRAEQPVATSKGDSTRSDVSAATADAAPQADPQAVAPPTAQPAASLESATTEATPAAAVPDTSPKQAPSIAPQESPGDRQRHEKYKRGAAEIRAAMGKRDMIGAKLLVKAVAALAQTPKQEAEIARLDVLIGHGGTMGRVAPGDCSPGAPTDPYVQNYRIRFLK